MVKVVYGRHKRSDTHHIAVHKSSLHTATGWLLGDALTAYANVAPPTRSKDPKFSVRAKEATWDEGCHMREKKITNISYQISKRKYGGCKYYSWVLCSMRPHLDTRPICRGESTEVLVVYVFTSARLEVFFQNGILRKSDEAYAPGLTSCLQQVAWGGG